MFTNKARIAPFLMFPFFPRPTASGINLWPGVGSYQTSAKDMARRLSTDREKGFAARKLLHLVFPVSSNTLIRSYHYAVAKIYIFFQTIVIMEVKNSKSSANL